MRHNHAVVLFIVICGHLCAGIAISPSQAGEYRFAEEYSCLPERGVIKLPGVKYDDLTPLAREIFNDNPTAVSDALYALPLDKREEFIILYLEPFARDTHRAFFIRCREVASRKELDGVLKDGDIIPASIRRELTEREQRRLALNAGALPFRIGDRTIYVPAPEGYDVEDNPPVTYVRDSGAATMAVFRKITRLPENSVRRPVWASVNHVRASEEAAITMLRAYETMVDSDWRAIAVYPPDGFADEIESVEFKWNLQPFLIRDNSFCYGQFTKTGNANGVTQITYKATAVTLLRGAYVQASIVYETNATLDNVNEVNTDMVNWQNAILAANWELY